MNACVFLAQRHGFALLTSQQLDQNLLRGVFGVLREVHHSHGNVVDPILMAPHEALECVAVAVLDSAYQFKVVGIGFGGVSKRMASRHRLRQGGGGTPIHTLWTPVSGGV